MVRTAIFAMVIAFCVNSTGLATTRADELPVTLDSRLSSHPDIVQGSRSFAGTTYTVWYKVPGRRWTGITGLSYYHATRMRDAYQAKGWASYIEQE